MAKYRDRKLGKTFSFAGQDCYADTTARGHIRNAFESGTGVVSNWDAMEHVLDHIFIKLGMNGVDGAIDLPGRIEPFRRQPDQRKVLRLLQHDVGWQW